MRPLFRLTLKLVFEWIFSTSETRLVAIYPSKPVGYFFDAVEYLFCITILTGTKETTCEFFFGAYYAPQLKFTGALKLHVYSLRNAPKKSSLRQSVFNDCRIFVVHRWIKQDENSSFFWGFLLQIWEIALLF